ncbi:MAG TPA: hypothetical protein VFH51_18460, partial [Myxococcota bacterium]|nr:hypothetical protein [Myxococcota bacterium]
MTAYDAQGRFIRLQNYVLTPARAVVQSVLPADVTLDAEADVARVPLRHPEAVGSVDCTDASCEVDGKEVLVHSEHGADESLEMRVLLRPHVYLQAGTALQNSPVVAVPLQRCPVSLASTPPLRGFGNQNLVLRIGGRCRQEAALRFFVGGVAARVASTRIEDDAQYAVVHADSPVGDDVTVAVQRGTSVVGLVHAHTRIAPTVHARIELQGFGAIDFIPTNRDATVVLPSLGDGGVLVPLAVDGVYNVARDEAGTHRVRGIEGTTGWVALRLAYRDKNLPPALRDTNLAEITDTVDRSIHPASLPIGLGASAITESPVVELVCGDGEGKARRIPPAVPTAVPYAARETCRLILHRERLEPEDGDQAMRIVVTISDAGGVTRNEASFDQRIILRPGSEPRYVYLSGVVAPFDKVLVRASLIADDTRYAVDEDDQIAAPQVQWQVTMGTDKMRLFVTTAMPTGLFRVADKGHSGLVG